MGPMRLLKTDFDAEIEGKEEGEDKGKDGMVTSSTIEKCNKWTFVYSGVRTTSCI